MTSIAFHSLLLWPQGQLGCQMKPNSYGKSNLIFFFKNVVFFTHVKGRILDIFEDFSILTEKQRMKPNKATGTLAPERRGDI